MKIKLGEHDKLLAAIQEYCSGPGWSNTPIWVFIWRGEKGEIEKETIQPDDQTKEMCDLFSVCAAAHRSMLRAVIRVIK